MNDIDKFNDDYLNDYTDKELLSVIKDNTITHISKIEYVYVYYDYNLILVMDCNNKDYNLMFNDTDFEKSIDLELLKDNFSLDISSLKLPLFIFGKDKEPKILEPNLIEVD